MDGLLRRPALTINRRAGNRLRPSGREHRAAPDVPGLLTDLGDAAPDHVVHIGWIESGAVGERSEHVGGQIDRVDAGQPALPPADRGSHRPDDDRIPHCRWPSG